MFENELASRLATILMPEIDRLVATRRTVADGRDTIDVESIIREIESMSVGVLAPLLTREVAEKAAILLTTTYRMRMAQRDCLSAVA